MALTSRGGASIKSSLDDPSEKVEHPAMEPSDQSPNPAKWQEWFAHRIRKEWHVIRQAPLAMTGIFVLGCFASWQVIQWQKNSVIEHKSAEVEHLELLHKTDADEVSKLKSEKHDLQIQLSLVRSNLTDTARLKQTTSTLVQQLLTITKEYETNHDYVAFFNSYELNYVGRVSKVQAQMGDLGLRSQRLDHARSTESFSADCVRTIASELQSLADQLK